MIVLKLILFTLYISGLHCRYPDKVYCANEGCDAPISKAKTLINYNSIDPDLISFSPKSEAVVYMKSAGTNSDLWFVNINGQSGFVNSKFLREYRILEKSPQVLVSYEPKPQENVQPNRVQQAHEVIEGTTIYTTEAAVNNAQQEATTESPVLSSTEDLTPSLESASQRPSENNDNIIQNIGGDDKNVLAEDQQDVNANSEIPPKDSSDEDLDNKKTIAEQTEALFVSEHLDEKKREPAEIQDEKPATESVLDPVIKNEEQKEPPSVEQFEKEYSKEPIIDTSTQPSTDDGTLNSEPLLVPDSNDINSLTDPEQTDIKEQNISNPLENVQTEEHTTESNNVSNDEINNLNEPVTDQSQENIITDSVDPANINQIDNDTSDATGDTTNEESVPQLEPVVEQPTETLPAPEQIPPKPETESLPAILENEPSLPFVPENEPKLPPATETVPTLFPPLDTIPVLPPVTTETIPAFYPPIIPDSIPENQYNQQQEIPHFDTETTTSAPIEYVESTSQQPPVFIPDQDPYFPINSPKEENSNANDNQQSEEELSVTTEAPVENQNTEGFISNLYTTVADMWPSTTEAPPSIYNTEEYPTYEKGNGEKVENLNEGFSFMKYIMNTYYSVMGTSEESKALFAAVGETCYTDEYCDGTSNDGTNRLLTFLLTTASSVLLFTLGYYYIDNRRQDGRLIGQINSLQRDLLFTTKECEILKEDLSSTKNKLAGIEDSSFGMDDMVQSLKVEISELKTTNDRLRNSLDDNEKLLRVSENTAGELQNTLSEVENTLSELLAERANSEEQIVELNGKIQAFEEELISVSRDRDNFQLKYVSAESASEELKKQKKQLEDITQQLTEAKNTIVLQKHEIDALKDALKDFNSGMPSNVDVASLIDHTEIKAKLSKALEEKKSFETKYESEHKERSRLAEELQTTQETLHTTSQNATEALTRLDVLGKYFQERESELLKELSTKESLWLSKQGESASTVEKMELLQQEIQRYKEKCDALTLELAEQESARRAALSAVEARAHAAWLEARAARRDADAARDEAAALRRKLASLSSAADGAVSPHHKVVSPLENVENPVIPPPLPPMYLPPPLLPPLPRPPPLGRLPSPHPPRYGDRRYSPESRYSPDSRYSPESRYSPQTVRYSPDSRYSPRARRSPYSPRSRRRSRSRSRERYPEGPARSTRSRNGPADTETEYNSDSPTREPRRRRYSRHSGPSSGSGCSSDSDK